MSTHRIRLASGAEVMKGIGEGSIGTFEIENESILAEDLAPNSVTEPKIANGAVSEGKLAVGVAEKLNAPGQVNGVVVSHGNGSFSAATPGVDFEEAEAVGTHESSFDHSLLGILVDADNPDDVYEFFMSGGVPGFRLIS